MTLVYLVAGEASGDLLGARLIIALRAARPDLTFAGVGGDRMAEQGFTSLFPMRELAVMGLAEVLPNIRRLSQRLVQTVADIEARRPAVVVTIDSPGFGLRVAARVRPKGFTILHYVAPQVWAWRQGRVKRIAKEVDRILALLPFEAPFFEKAGIPVDFVGHSILESGADQGNAARFRALHNIAPDERIVLIMPGSRRSEVGRLLPTFGAALKLAAGRVPKLRPVVPLAGPVEESVRAVAASWHPAPILVRDIAEKYDAFAAAEAGIIKSGTSSLEVALAGVPMVVGYRVNPTDRRHRAPPDQGGACQHRQPSRQTHHHPRTDPGRVHAGETLRRAGAAVDRSRRGQRPARRLRHGVRHAAARWRCAERGGGSGGAAGDGSGSPVRLGKEFPRPLLLFVEILDARGVASTRS
jgi:lipid-A-disaccharide synthase